MRKLSLILSVLFVLSMATVVFAQAAAPATSTAPVDSLGLGKLIKGLLVGAVVGFAVAYLGFMKDKDTNKKWDFKQAAPTLIWGAIVGALTGLGQKDLSSFDGFKDNAATVIIAELIGKAGFRTGAPVIGNVVSTLLGKKADETK